MLNNVPYLVLYQNDCMYSILEIQQRYHPVRLFKPQGGTIAKALFCSSNAICFTFFYFDLEFCKEDLSFLLPDSENPLILSFFGEQLVWNPLFLFAGAFLFDEKSAKVLRKRVWETPIRPTNIKCMVPAFFGGRFVETVGMLSTYKPASKKQGCRGIFVSNSLEL